MTCPHESELSLFAGGDVGGRQANRIEQHLHVCSACAQALHEFRVIRSAVTNSGVPMPPHMRTALPRQVLTRIALVHGEADQMSLWPRLRWGIAAVVTACVSIAIWGIQPDQHSLALPQAALVPVRPPEQAFALSASLRNRQSGTPSVAAAPETARNSFDTVKLSLVSDANGEDTGVTFRVSSKDPTIEIHWLMD